MGAYLRWALIRGWVLIKFSPFSAGEVYLFCNKTLNGEISSALQPEKSRPQPGNFPASGYYLHPWL